MVRERNERQTHFRSARARLVLPGPTGGSAIRCGDA